MRIKNCWITKSVLSDIDYNSLLYFGMSPDSLFTGSDLRIRQYNKEKTVLK